MLEMNDPYAAIRSVELDAPMSHKYDWYRAWSAPNSSVRYEDLTPEQQSIYDAYLENSWAKQRHGVDAGGGGVDDNGNSVPGPWTFGLEWGQRPELQPYRSKYQSITDIGGGNVVVRLQRPGMHKYDTMDVLYALDPSTGRYVMQGEPNYGRQVSSMQQMVHDPFDAAAKFVGSAAALYGAATGVNALLGGAGGGFGAAEAGLLSGGDAGLAAAAGSGGGIGTLGTLPAVPAPLAPISAAGAVAPLTAAELSAGLTGLSLPALSAAPAATGGGSLLSKIPGPIGKFVSDNPNLSRGLFSLVGAGLGGGGAFNPGGGGGGGSPAPAGPAKQWATPIQQAIFTPAQQWMPDAIKPGALSMGAGRFLGG